MGDFLTAGVTLFWAKFATIMAALTMAGIAVAIDAKRHSPLSAVLAIFAGTVMGVIAASSIVALMGWPESVGYGVASIFAISGNNLVKWLLRVSQDPTSLLRLWLGRGADKE